MKYGPAGPRPPCRHNTQGGPFGSASGVLGESRSGAPAEPADIWASSGRWPPPTSDVRDVPTPGPVPEPAVDAFAARSARRFRPRPPCPRDAMRESWRRDVLQRYPDVCQNRHDSATVSVTIGHGGPGRLVVLFARRPFRAIDGARGVIDARTGGRGPTSALRRGGPRRGAGWIRRASARAKGRRIPNVGLAG